MEDYKKKYEEALERARCYKGLQAEMSVVFPELGESEDERIRKEMIFYFEQEIPQCSIQEHADKMKAFIAWLEKQGRQKATIIIPKFRVGDEIKTSNEESLTITKIDEKGYWSEDLFICSFEDSAKWELVGKLVDKVEPKFHEGDIIKPKDDGRLIGYKDALHKISTLEVKEVGLKAEIDRVWDNTSDNFSEDGWKEFEDIAKHFFELGLKAQDENNKTQKGE